MNTRVEIGHLGRFWNDDFKQLIFVKQPVTDEEVKTWQDMGYDHVKSFTGSMYDNSKPMPDWIATLERMFGLYNQTYTFYRMNTLEIMPVHVDHYRTYCRINNVSTDKVCRIVMMLEDWKPGHYFELDGIGYTNWKAGDYFMWKGDVPHAASNIGVEPRYTLQITGLSIYEGQLNQLFSTNIPDMETNHSNPMVTLDILPKLKDTHNMVYLNNRYIKELDSVHHSEETIDLLNKEGLHIYLYEPMCSYQYPFEKHTQGFYSEFSKVDNSLLRSEELDSIYDYVKRNYLSNVTVHTCDYDIENYYINYTDRLQLVCDDLFLKTQKKIMHLTDKPVGRFIRNFICLNWRFTKHRQLVSTFLAGEEGYLSWYYKADFDALKKDLFFDLEEWKTTHPEHYEKLKKGCDITLSQGPFTIDKHDAQPTVVTDPYHVDMYPNVTGIPKGETPALYNRVNNELSNYYFESFVDIINETRYAQPTANYSEKVYQAMQYLRPFILVAPPKTLEYLKSMGFKTFGEFWDESYDDELDHGERLAKIFTLINHVFAMPNDKQRELYENMVPILTHNLNRYKELTK
jgi:hypothetical protein